MKRASFLAPILASFLFLAALSLGRRCWGQVVNVQPLLSATPRIGPSAVVEGSLDWRTGNTRLLLVAGSATLRYGFEGSMLFATFRGEVGYRGADNFVRRHFEHLRYRWRIAGPIEGEAFVQYQEDVFRRLAVRALVGAGPRVKLVEGSPLDLVMGATPMLEFERLGGGSLSDANEETRRIRASFYASAVVAAGAGVRLTQSMYLQPDIANLRDVRVLHEVEVSATMNKTITFKWSLSSLYDSRPPLTVQPLDATLKSSLALSF